MRIVSQANVGASLWPTCSANAMIGKALGNDRIANQPLGNGGLGEVNRAKNQKLGRLQIMLRHISAPSYTNGA